MPYQATRHDSPVRCVFIGGSSGRLSQPTSRDEHMRRKELRAVVRTAAIPNEVWRIFRLMHLNALRLQRVLKPSKLPDDAISSANREIVLPN